MSAGPWYFFETLCCSVRKIECVGTWVGWLDVREKSVKAGLVASSAPPSFNFLESVPICMAAKQCPEVGPHCRMSRQRT
jgi:hypothetical protein